MWYCVEYNAQLMALYKSLRACLNLVQRKGWRDDEKNLLRVFDSEGEEYNPETGARL